jgi:hypothetical protein
VIRRRLLLAFVGTFALAGVAGLLIVGGNLAASRPPGAPSQPREAGPFTYSAWEVTHRDAAILDGSPPHNARVWTRPVELWDSPRACGAFLRGDGVFGDGDPTGLRRDPSAGRASGTCADPDFPGFGELPVPPAVGVLPATRSEPQAAQAVRELLDLSQPPEQRDRAWDYLRYLAIAPATPEPSAGHDQAEALTLAFAGDGLEHLVYDPVSHLPVLERFTYPYPTGPASQERRLLTATLVDERWQRPAEPVDPAWLVTRRTLSAG